MDWVDIIEDFVGSTIEIISMVLLLNLVSSSYWLSKWKTFAGSAIAASFIVLFDQWNLPLLFLLNIVAIVIVFTIIIKRHIIATSLEILISYVFIWCIQYPLVMLFYHVKLLNSLGFMGVIIQLFILFVCCAWIGFNKRLKKMIRPIYRNNQREVYIITVTLFLVCAIELCLWRYNELQLYRDSPIISLFIILWFGLSLVLLKNMVDKKKQRQTILLHEQYMEMTEQLMNRLYKDKHDFKKHLQTILGFCHCETADEAVNRIKEYLTSMKLNEQKQEDEGTVPLSINTGNGIINALLYSKGQEAKGKDIQLFYVPSGSFPSFPCEQYELVQIIGNLLDNAMEYVELLEKKYRRVILSIDDPGGKKRIEIRNPYFMNDKTLRHLNDSKVHSTKKGGRRGYGLTNVREIVDKCHGKFELSYEDNEFVARVLF